MSTRTRTRTRRHEPRSLTAGREPAPPPADSRHSHRKLAGHLAKAAGCLALLVEYRLAPEHPFPAAVDDCAAAYRWLLARGFRPDCIATAGDSAGGNLATATVLKLKLDGLPLPAATVAFSPW